MGYLNDLSQEYHDDSVRWFPGVHEPVSLTGQEHAIQHFAFGIGGEAGEIVNKVKKFLGYKDQSAVHSIDWLRNELGDELPDVIAYCLDLAAELDIDIDTKLKDKRGICFGRWEQGYDWDSVPIGHYVPGSGEIIQKSRNAGTVYVTFVRDNPGTPEVWSAGHDPKALVPVALTSHGLIYPNPKNVIRGDDGTD